MKNEEFSEFLNNEVLVEIRNRLTRKADEYARGDRFSNFNIAATFQVQNVTREAAAFGFTLKHLESIKSLIEDLEDGVESSYSIWHEKLLDAVNYLILILAMRSEYRKLNVVSQSVLTESIDAEAGRKSPLFRLFSNSKSDEQEAA